MGPVNARRRIRESLALCRPPLVLTCGLAGGLDPTLPFGAIVFDAEPGFPLYSALESQGARRARFFCSDRILVSRAEKATARAATGADAVEMESAPIREACCQADIPSATVRVISDTAQEDLPIDFGHVLTSDMRLRYGRLLWLGMWRPRLVRSLLLLQRRSQAAAERLAATLERALQS
jgi:nucleoside phosphorylase